MTGGSIGGTLGTALGVALAPETGGLSLAIPGFAGAAGSALGGALTGSKNIGRDALLGGIGGLAGGGLNNLTGNVSGLGNYFNTGNGISGMLPSWLGGTSGAIPEIATNGMQSLAPSVLPSTSGAASSASSSGLFGNIGKFLPYAGLGVGATLLDSMNKPKNLGPPLQNHPSNPGQVSPLARTEQNVDPNSYFAPSTQANRSYFSPYPMQPQFMAKGGVVKGYANGGSSSASSSNIPMQRASSVGGKLINSGIKHPSMYPIKGKNNGTFRYYADGGPAGLGMINGPGDGQSDSIPAKLSDGEFVMSAPVVSALGNGSNDAGAAKLDRVQKNVLKKHYKGGKPHKAMGLNSYVH